jgi:hypothetical protein
MTSTYKERDLVKLAIEAHGGLEVGVESHPLKIDPEPTKNLSVKASALVQHGEIRRLSLPTTLESR